MMKIFKAFQVLQAFNMFAVALWVASVAVAQAATVLEPTTQNFIDALDEKRAPPIYTLTPKDARAVLEIAQAQAQTIEKMPAEIEDRVLPLTSTQKVSIRIIRPQYKQRPLPMVMYFHGGGWMLGSKQTHDRLMREIANGAQVEIIFVEYGRSPEAQYPVPIEQAYAVTKYVFEHPAEFNGDAKRLAVAGDSVGGNIAAAVTLLAKERGGPKIGFQLLFYPVTNADFDNQSYNEFANGPWLTRNAMKWFWNAYAPNSKDRKQITASPLRATINQLKGLPPALIITDENDVLRDEGEAYARKLTQAGVSVISVRYNGTVHDFVMLNALAKTPAARAAIQQAVDALKSEL